MKINLLRGHSSSPYIALLMGDMKQMSLVGRDSKSLQR